MVVRNKQSLLQSVIFVVILQCKGRHYLTLRKYHKSGSGITNQQCTNQLRDLSQVWKNDRRHIINGEIVFIPDDFAIHHFNI